MGLFNRSKKVVETAPLIDWDSMHKVFRDEHGKWCLEGKPYHYPTEKQALLKRKMVIDRLKARGAE